MAAIVLSLHFLRLRSFATLPRCAALTLADALQIMAEEGVAAVQQVQQAPAGGSDLPALTRDMFTKLASMISGELTGAGSD